MLFSNGLRAQELRAAGKDAEAAALETKIASAHEAAEQAATTRQEKPNAAPSPEAVKPPPATGGASQETSTQSPQASGQKVSAPIPPESIKALQSKLSTSAIAAPIPPSESFRNQQVEVRGADGAWKPGKVDFDSLNDVGSARRLRGVLDSGEKFANVKAQDVRKAQGKVGVDFDGTLFTENADGSIGKPIPERIASLKQDLADGKQFIVESHRAKHPGEVAKIQDALESVGLPRLPVTAKKTDASELIDDKEKKEPGVKVDSVGTDKNTSLPQVTAPGQAPKPPVKEDRSQPISGSKEAEEWHKEAFNLAKDKLGKDAKWGEILAEAAKIQQAGKLRK